MKAGLAAALLAVEAATTVGPELLGPLAVVGVIEEECTGNGTLVSLLAGVTADGVLLPEPTDLTLLTGGVGVVWCDVTVVGGGAHAAMADQGTSALELALPLIAALKALERELDEAAAPGERCFVNVGTMHAGD